MFDESELERLLDAEREFESPEASDAKEVLYQSVLEASKVGLLASLLAFFTKSQWAKWIGALKADLGAAALSTKVFVGVTGVAAFAAGSFVTQKTMQAAPIAEERSPEASANEEPTPAASLERGAIESSAVESSAIESGSTEENAAEENAAEENAAEENAAEPEGVRSVALRNDESPTAEPATEPPREASELAPNAPATRRVSQAMGQAEASSQRGEERSTLVQEHSLIRDALGSLRAGAPDRALIPLQQYRNRFPEGALREEALRLELEAQVQLDRLQVAERLLRELRRDYPNSPHLRGSEVLVGGLRAGQE